MGQTTPVSLYELLVYLRNFFPGEKWQFFGEDITEKRLLLPGLENGDYYLIEGSRRNNGIHVYGNSDLRSETYSGIVTELCIPTELLILLDEINVWQEKHAEALQSPYQSESFGGYSYTKASESGGTGESMSWKTVFAPRLRMWRKI
jgi:hypothetical protein